MRYIYILFKKFFKELFNLLIDEFFFWKDMVLDFKNIISNISNLFRNKVFSGLIFIFLTLIIIIKSFIFDVIIITLLYFLVKIIFHLLSSYFTNIKELISLLYDYIKIYLFDNFKLLIFIFISFNLFKSIFGLLNILLSINYINLFYLIFTGIVFIIILLMGISGVKENGDKQFENYIKKSNNNDNKERKLSKHEKSIYRLNKKINDCRKSILRRNIKGTKKFYECKKMLFCSECGNVGYLHCGKCGKRSQRRKKGGKCPNCTHILRTINCSKCNNTQYLK